MAIYEKADEVNWWREELIRVINSSTIADIKYSIEKLNDTLNEITEEEDTTLMLIIQYFDPNSGQQSRRAFGLTRTQEIWTIHDALFP